MERVVKRSDLEPEDNSVLCSPELDDIETIRRLKAFDTFNSSETNPVAAVKNHATATIDDELEFRLFATEQPTKTSEAAHPAQKIRLRSPSVDRTNAGFLQPSRRSTYYLAQPLSLAERNDLEASAVTGEQVLALSKSPRPGSTYPWKVLKLPATHKNGVLLAQERWTFRKVLHGSVPQRRKRAGKKYRIRIRTKQAALRAQKEAGKIATEAKEAAEREKRTRRNREKKVKKRMRDKAKKVQAAGGDGEPASEGSDPGQAFQTQQFSAQ